MELPMVGLQRTANISVLTISHLCLHEPELEGDLRVRVNQACAEKIATVSLQLQLDEYSEVKYL